MLPPHCEQPYNGDSTHGFCANETDMCGGPPIPIESDAKGRKQYLVIGDSVSGIYWMALNQTLTNSSNVQAYAAPTNCGDSRNGAECIQEWVGADMMRWDIITYNFGMWDINREDCNASTYPNGMDVVCVF